MKRLLFLCIIALVLPRAVYGQLGFKNGFMPALGLFPSSGTSCTVEHSFNDNTKKNKNYWLSCSVGGSPPNVRLSLPGYATTPGDGSYGLVGVMVKIVTTHTSARRLCAVFSSHQYFTHGALQVNQSGTDWRRTAWFGGSLGNAREITIAANTAPWVVLIPPSLTAASRVEIIDVSNANPNPPASLGEIVNRELIIGGCNQFCSGTNPPSCCPSNCTDDYTGTIHVWGANSY